MEVPKIFESEYRFCLILWEHEPVNSTRLVELCKEHDNLTIGLKNRYQHRQEKRGELDEAKSRYLTRRDAGELAALLEELREHFHDIGSISDEAREVRDELNRLEDFRIRILSAVWTMPWYRRLILFLIFAIA